MSKLSEFLNDQTSIPQGQPDVGLREILGKVWDAVSPVAAHGAHELASALFRGDAYIQYPHQQPGVELQQDQGHGLPVEPMKQPEMEM